jgi:hypothetical protein
LLQVVPTEYVDLKGSSTNSNQFSVTENFREGADAHAGGRSLPGVFFFYDLSPIKVGGWLGMQQWGLAGCLLLLARVCVRCQPHHLPADRGCRKP